MSHITDFYAAPEALVAHCRRAVPRTERAAPRTERVAVRRPYTGETSSHAGKATKLQYDEVASAPEGTRNDALNKASYKLGQYIGAGELSEEQAKKTMLAACGSNGSLDEDGEGQCLATIKSGIKGGIKDPVRTGEDMFEGVPADAAKGASMMGGFAAKRQVLKSILQAVPVMERKPEHPTAPYLGLSGDEAAEEMTHLLNERIPGIVETRDPWAWAAWRQLHDFTATETMGIAPADVKNFTEVLGSRIVNQLKADTDVWAKNRHQEIDPRSPVNFGIFLKTKNMEIRFNAWIDDIEIRGGDFKKWTAVDDNLHATLKYDAASVGYFIGKDALWDFLLAFARRNIINEAVDHLTACERGWDGKQRLEGWLSQICGVPDDLYHRAAGKTFLIGLVGRVLQPRIKFDLMLVLVSEKQGTGKNKVAEALAMRPEWLSETLALGMEAKELIPLLAGKLVAEVSEMRSKKDVNDAKAMITRRTDSARTAYARKATSKARSSVLVGSANNPQFLTDESGNRRFLPVEVMKPHVNDKWLRDHMGQLAGEAVHEFRAMEAAAGGTLNEIALPPEAWAAAAVYQENARTGDDVEVWLEHEFGTTGDGWIVPVDLVNWKKAKEVRMTHLRFGAIMNKLGFSNRTYRFPKEQELDRYWVRGKPTKEDAFLYLGGHFTLLSAAKAQADNVYPMPAPPAPPYQPGVPALPPLPRL